MLNLCLTYKWLRWTPPNSPPPALPDGIERNFLQTPGGPIEILYAKPRGSTTASVGEKLAPVFFVHGGMGSAWVWLGYMAYLSAHGVPCYAISLRGHGESYHPSFWRMVYGTTKRMLADDLVAGIRWTQQREGQDVVLVGHSSGGGLSQLILSAQDVQVKGLALVGAVPGFGSMGVYINWWLLDPLFTIRMVFHGWHPNSPLSHPFLTKRAFFSDEVSDSYVEEFQSHINAYESLLWPVGMMAPFVRPERMLPRISSWGKGQRILVLQGGADKLMTRPVMRKLAEAYRAAVRSLAGQKKLEAEDDGVVPVPGAGNQDDVGRGVRFCVVPGAGHHMQNDVQWEVGARKLLDFYEQL